tara:strand:- start:808 stop:1104 length:297 start_codon:yes stop_codon:yes gene_type:complete
MTNERGVEEVLKSIMELIDEAQNLENQVEDKSSKEKLEFKTKKTSKKSKIKSYSDWSGKKFTDQKNNGKKHLLGKKIAKIFESEFSEWVQVNMKKNSS